jgi:PadR family transcriptional regulator, regulatory protein PadR
MEANRNELLPGTLDLLILSTLQSGPAHGYTIMDSIWSSSGELFRVEEGALYPALHRLQVKGFLEAEWGVSEANRRAKFYRLTPSGKKQLAMDRANWDRVATGMRRILRSTGA